LGSADERVVRDGVWRNVVLFHGLKHLQSFLSLPSLLSGVREGRVVGEGAKGV
jgi:hypothetical protein